MSTYFSRVLHDELKPDLSSTFISDSQKLGEFRMMGMKNGLVVAVCSLVVVFNSVKVKGT